MSDKFEQWFESYITSKNKYGIVWSDKSTSMDDDEFKLYSQKVWNAALSSVQGDQAAKIAELESELAEQARLLGISAERELALQAKLAEVAEVEKDAERYNWLCDHCVDFEEYTEGDSFTVKSLHFEYSPNIYLHQAIDSAIQESKKGGE